MYNKYIINLTVIHPWMSFEEAHLLFKFSYYKNSSQKNKFGNNTFLTLMGIDYGMYQWQTKEWIEERIKEAKQKFNYNDNG